MKHENPAEAGRPASAGAIFRPVRPGGFVMMTLHGDRYKDRLLDDELEAYNAGKLVIRGSETEGKKWYTAVHSPLYARKFLKGLEVVVDCLNFGLQDIWAVSLLGVDGESHR